MSESNITPYVKNSFTFFKSLNGSNLSSELTVVRRFFTWTALGGGDLGFSLTLVRKANAVDSKLDNPRDYITNVINPYALLMA
jgi:hypothetical protein